MQRSMLATVVLSLFLLLFPSASPPVTYISPGVHAIEAGDQTREIVDLSPQAARAYHLVRLDGTSVEYRVSVLRGGPIDVYLMPAETYQVYASQGTGEYIAGFSQQATKAVQRSFNDGAYLDTYLVVDNLDGPTGATPTGNVTVEVTILQADPRGPEAALSNAIMMVLALTLTVVPGLVYRYIGLTGRKLPLNLPPPPGP